MTMPSKVLIHAVLIKDTLDGKKREMALDFYRKIGAYMTDILPVLSDEEYNVLFLPVNERPSRSELKAEFLGIYKEILPSFKDKKKYITRLTEEVDGLV